MKFTEFFSGKGKPRNAAFKWFVSENKQRPSPPPPGGASPQGEAAKRLTIFSGKMKFAEFFSDKGKPELKAKKFFAENFANPPEKRLQFFFGYGIVYKLLMQTEV